MGYHWFQYWCYQWDITSYRVIAKLVCTNSAWAEISKKNPGPEDGTDPWSAINDYPIGTISVICFCFHQFTPLRRIQGLQKWKRVENQAYPLRPMVQFWWFQCVIWERSKHCVHMKRHIYCQNSSIMSQQHSFENKSWPLDDLEIWPFDLFTL